MSGASTAIVLFTRLPQDEVKLNESLPARSRTGLFQRLISHFSRQASRIEGADVLFAIATANPQPTRIGFFSQRGATFGQRLANVFRDVFGAGYDRVVVVGNDCPELTAEDLAQAVCALGEHPAVVGPAEDGGCYLIGLRDVPPDLLEFVDWSQKANCPDLVRLLRSQHHTVFLLEPRLDLDTLDDIRRFAARHRRKAEYESLVTYLDACLAATRAQREGIPFSETPYLAAIEEERIDWQIPPPIVHA